MTWDVPLENKGWGEAVKNDLFIFSRLFFGKMGRGGTWGS